MHSWVSEQATDIATVVVTQSLLKLPLPLPTPFPTSRLPTTKSANGSFLIYRTTTDTRPFYERSIAYSLMNPRALAAHRPSLVVYCRLWRMRHHRLRLMPACTLTTTPPSLASRLFRVPTPLELCLSLNGVQLLFVGRARLGWATLGRRWPACCWQ